MCFVIDRSSPEPLIADSDIVCYKEGTLMHIDDGRPVFVSLFQGYIYRFQERQPELTLRPDRKGSRYISKGYHSYHPRNSILQSFTHECSSRVLVKCIIPKGSMYYYTPYYQEYVSSCLIVLGVEY